MDGGNYLAGTQAMSAGRYEEAAVPLTPWPPVPPENGKAPWLLSSWRGLGTSG